jgi:hypothetical protein
MVLVPLANFCVPAKAGCASNIAVPRVARLMPASVECGRMLVSISLDAFADPTPVLTRSDKESLTRAVPSARQKPSVSSVSTRLHEGQRFIFGVLRLVAVFLEISRPAGLVSDPSLTRGKAVISHRTPKLLRKAHPPQQISVSRITAERLER